MTRLSLLLVGLLWTGPGQAQDRPLVVDLSDHLVAITTGFAGAEVLAFGAVDQPGDVVVAIRGPKQPTTLYRKSRIAGIWVNSTSMTFEAAPSFFAIASSRPLEEIASESVRRLNQLGLDYLHGLELSRVKGSENVRRAWKAALIRNMQREGLYPIEDGRVGFQGNRLFRTRINFPANVPTGAYSVETYQLIDGQVVSATTTPLIVSKVGIEAEVFDFAHQHGGWYGVIAILVALVAGWLAHVAFRRA